MKCHFAVVEKNNFKDILQKKNEIVLNLVKST